MMRYLLTVAALSGALVLAACNAPAAPQGNYGNISGTVTSASGQPVAGVVVRADYAITSTTQADGKYALQGVPISGPNAPAYVDVTSVPSGYRIPAPRNDVVVQPGQTTQNINFTLTPG